MPLHQKESMSNHPIRAALPLTLPTDQLADGFIAPLSSQGILCLSGNDAISFAHRQFCNDIERLQSSEACLAGYCTPQGRLLASFLAWKSEKDVHLILPREILPALQKRLQIYVLRDKVQLLDNSQEYRVYGLGGKQAEIVFAPGFSGLPTQTYEKKENSLGTLIRVPDAFGFARYIWAIPASSGQALLPDLTKELHWVDENCWTLCEIDAGIPQITLATQDQFVPQMLNMELIGGISFQKGCYPGQEIIARNQHHSHVSRRMMQACVEISGQHMDSRIAAGVEAYADSNQDQACGMLVSAARRDSQRIDCLIVIEADFASSGNIHIGSADGSLLHLGSLPYALPEDFLKTG